VPPLSAWNFPLSSRYPPRSSVMGLIPADCRRAMTDSAAVCIKRRPEAIVSGFNFGEILKPNAKQFELPAA